MANFFQLVTVALALGASPAFAGYAQVAPPAGWQSANTFNFSTQAGNAAVYSANGVNTVRTTAALNVAGRTVSVPAAMRFASNAGQFAATRSFHPALLLGGLALPYVLQWVANKNWELRPDADEPGGQAWYEKQITPGAGYRCYTSTTGGGWYPVLSSGWYATNNAACAAWAAAASAASTQFNYQHDPGYSAQSIKVYNKANSYQGRVSITGQFQNNPDTITYRKLTEQEFIDGASPLPIPAPMPTFTPWDWPIEAPQINPNPYPTGAPAPLVVPTGNPIWDPVSQTWKQPAVRVVPSPNTVSPWRVDLQPIEVSNPTESPISDPIPDPFNPTATPGTPLQTPTATGTVSTVTSPNGQPSGTTATDKPTQQLCEAFPDILACQKLDTPTAENLPTKDVSITITPDSGWGNASATCPAPRVIHPAGRDVPIPFDLFCQYMTGIRPVVIAMAWLAAAFIVVGFKGSE